MEVECEQKNSNIKKVFLILSGKGGVGKSSVTTQLAYALFDKGFKVIDTDQILSYLSLFTWIVE